MVGEQVPQSVGESLGRGLRGGLLCVLALASVGCASIAEHQRTVAEGRNTTQLERKLWESEAFLRHHPDVKHRKLGFWYQQQGDQARSLAAFEEAARHADKAAQAIIAEWYFEGIQQPRDLPRAYAFMDLAAERGYPVFLAKREQYWSALDPDQRKQALAIGEQLYAEFGDAVAKPRMERALRLGRMGMTGSRVASPSALTVLLPLDGNWQAVPGSVYYRNAFWRPREYFEWVDALHLDPPHGVVEVGPMQPASGAAASPPPG